MSFQTISKWENDVSMPDIAILPIIADCFEISIDKLLGYHKKQREMEIREIAQITHEKEKVSLKDAYEYLEGQIGSYSSSIKSNHLLAATAYHYSKELEGEKKRDMLQNAMETAGLVIKLDDGNTAKTAQAKMCIAYCLRDLGMNEQAIKIADNMPSMFSSREVMLFRILDGDEKKRQAQINLEYIKELENEMQEFM